MVFWSKHELLRAGSCGFEFQLLFVPQGCLDNSPQTRRLQTREISSLTVLEDRSPRSRYWQGSFLLEALRENPRHASPSFRWLPTTLGIFWLIDTSLHSLPPSFHYLLLCVCDSYLPLPFSYKGTCHQIEDSYPGRSHLQMFDLIPTAKMFWSLFMFIGSGEEGHIHTSWRLGCGHVFVGPSCSPLLPCGLGQSLNIDQPQFSPSIEWRLPVVEPL